MRKEMRVLNDNTTMTIEHTIGRCDITITTMIKGVFVSNGVIHVDGKVHEEKAFYWIELKKGEWIISFCVNGFCYNSVEIGRTMTKKEAILTIIDRHTSNHWYDFGCYGECFVSEFEAQTISKVIADYAQSEFVYVREYDGGHFKAYPNGYVFEYDESIEEPENTIKSEEEEEAENEYFVNQMSEPEPEYIGVEYMDARRLYILACLQSYKNCYELDMMLREMHMNQEVLSMLDYMKLTKRNLENGKDYEKSLLGYCKNMQYLTESIIAYALTQKEGETNDNC